MNAMILAAGRGERLRPITDRVPKPLVEVGGRSLVERHLERLAEAGVQRVVINLGWLGEQIAARVGSGRKYGLTVIYSPEYDRILDTGGGIRRALPWLGDAPFWVVNGDVLSDFLPSPAPLDEHALGHLVLVPTPGYRQGGDFALDDRGRVSNTPPRKYTFAGIACYRPAILAQQAPARFSLVPLLRAAADAGRLSGEVHLGRWEDVGTPERLAALNGESGSA